MQFYEAEDGELLQPADESRRSWGRATARGSAPRRTPAPFASRARTPATCGCAAMGAAAGGERHRTWRVRSVYAPPPARRTRVAARAVVETITISGHPLPFSLFIILQYVYELLSTLYWSAERVRVTISPTQYATRA